MEKCCSVDEIILLSADELSLAYAEVKGAAAGEDAVIKEIHGRIAVVSGSSPGNVFSRMGYARMHSSFVASGSMEELKKQISSFELPEGSFAVRSCRYSEFPGKGMDVERSIGDIVGRQRKIDLKNPDNVLDIYLGERLYAGIHLEDKRGISGREPTKRPFFSPVTLHPRMARALFNLTGIKRRQRLLDPFCGTGAILLEASLCGMDAYGTDSDPEMIEGAGRNLAYYGVGAKLEVRDIDDIGHIRADAVSTDPPYGRSSTTNRESVESLYRRAFSSVADILDSGKRMSVILPSERYIGLAEDFRLIDMHAVRVHRSLTRHFYLLERS